MNRGLAVCCEYVIKRDYHAACHSLSSPESGLSPRAKVQLAPVKTIQRTNLKFVVRGSQVVAENFQA